MLKLNEGQKATYAGFQNWLNKSIKQAPVALLEGAAGTGKTTITLQMTRWAALLGFHVRGAAKTCKAATVLHEKGGIVTSSVAALLNGGSSLEPQLEGKGLLVIDEASMIDDIDLTRILKLTTKQGYKVLLIGDGCQLPPIKDQYGIYGREIVFTPGLTPDTWRLTEVMRQTGESGVLTYATAIRGTQKVLKLPASGMKDIRVVPAGELISEYVAALNSGENVMMLDSDNTERKFHNEKVRRMIGENRDIQPGETLVSLRNIKFREKYLIQNSTIWTATPRLKYIYSGTFTLGYNDGTGIKKEAVHLHFISDYIYNDSEGYETEFNVIIADSLPIPSWHNAWFYPTEWPEEVRQKYCAKVSAAENEKNGRKAKDTWTLGQATVVGTFGYSLTCHKAQGSQADTVYIASGSQNWRWMYTAVTRSAKNIVIADSVVAKMGGETYTEDSIFQLAKKYGQNETSTPYAGEYVDFNLPMAISHYQLPLRKDGKGQYHPLHSMTAKVITGMLQHIKAGVRHFSNEGMHLLTMANLLEDPKNLDDVIAKARQLPDDLPDCREIVVENAAELYKKVYACTETESGYKNTDACDIEHEPNLDVTIHIFVQQKDGYTGYGYAGNNYFWAKVEKALTLEDAYKKIIAELDGLSEQLNLTIRGNKALEKFKDSIRATWVLTDEHLNSERVGDRISSAILFDKQKGGDYGPEKPMSSDTEKPKTPSTDPQDAKIAELERQLAERDAAIKQFKAERDKAIAERDAAIAQFKEERARAEQAAADLKAFNKKFADFLFAQ